MAETNPNRLPNDPPTKNKKKKKKNSSKEVKMEEEDISSKVPKTKGDMEEVNINDLDLLHEILDYKIAKGVAPSDNPDDLREFSTPYIRLNIGNAIGWIRKMRELKTKFKNQSAPTDDIKKQEFELWKKIWGNHQDQPKGGDDSGVGSSK